MADDVNYLKELHEEMISKCLVCSICLKDPSSLSPVVECQNCSVTVHRGCYGAQESFSDDMSVSSEESDTERPWFCDPCRAGVINPACALCPISGGAFKETDEGDWVHQVCALFISEVNFEDPDVLFNVSLAELSPDRWGSHSCVYCEDYKVARNGVTIRCEKHFCSIRFHVTCGQKLGVLKCDAIPAELHASCVQHSCEKYTKGEKRNWNALQLRVRFMKTKRENERAEFAPNWMQNQIILMRYRERYARARGNEPEPQVPMEEVDEEEEEEDIPPQLIAGPSAPPMWDVQTKSTDTDSSNDDDLKIEMSLMRAAPYRYHIPPAFSLEFMSYVKDREIYKIPKLEQQVISNSAKKPSVLNKIIQYGTRQAQVKQRLTEAKQLGTTLLNNLQLFGTSIGRFNPRLKIPGLDMGGIVQHSRASSPAPSDSQGSNLGMVGVMSPHFPRVFTFSPPELSNLDMIDIMPPSPTPSYGVGRIPPSPRSVLDPYYSELPDLNVVGMMPSLHQRSPTFSPPEIPNLDMAGMTPTIPEFSSAFSAPEIPNLDMVGMMPSLPELSPAFYPLEIPNLDMVGVMSPPVPASAPDHAEVQPQDDE